MKAKKWVLIVGGSVLGLALIGGVAMAKHWQSASVEQKADWIAERVQDELDLNESQAVRLDAVKENVLTLRASMHSEENKTTMLADVMGERFDREKATALIEQKIAAMTTHSPDLVNAVANFYDSLDVEQREELREHLAKFQEHGRHHH